jgi:50S ribosomal protein L16 3-hydroxylase
VLLFVDGECFDCVGEVAGLAERLCAVDLVTVAPDLVSSDAAMELIATLFDRGSVAIE